MEEKMAMSVGLDRSVEVARLIMEAALWEARSQPNKQPDGSDTNASHLRVTTEHVRTGANLVLLALELVQERQRSETAIR